jgi:hypothetical protein
MPSYHTHIYSGFTFLYIFFSVFAAFNKESKYELDKQVMDYVQQFSISL